MKLKQVRIGPNLLRNVHYSVTDGRVDVHYAEAAGIPMYLSALMVLSDTHQSQLRQLTHWQEEAA